MSALPPNDPLRQDLVASAEFWHQECLRLSAEHSRERMLFDQERLALSDKLQATLQQLYEARAEINRLNDELERREVAA